MRRVRVIALWSLGLLVLSAAGLVVFLATAGDDFYRWAARQLLEGVMDRQVHVEGTFSFDVGLEPTLAVTEVWIENAPWAEKPEMGRVGRAEIQIAIRPLFAGIIQIPRLLVQDLTLDLERGPDGAANWEVAEPSRSDPDTAEEGDLFIPLFELISLRNVVVTYRDQRRTGDTLVLIESLERQKIGEETGFAIKGEGSLNQTDFSIKGRFGSVEEALAAATPYPFELTLEMAGLEAEMTGTAQNLPRAEGFDVVISAEAPSISRILETWNSDLAFDGGATASAKLGGDLEALSVEGLTVEIVDVSGNELRAEGSLSDLLHGKGLDVRFTAELVPEALPLLYEPDHDLREILIGAKRLDLAGRILGDLQAPAFEDLEAHLEHVSGADVSIQGRLALAISEEDATLTALEASTIISMPDPTLLQETLGARLPDIGAMYATSKLVWEDDWVMLHGLEIKAASFEAMKLSAEGRLARLSAKGFDFSFDPLIDIKASMNQIRPLVDFVLQPSKEAEAPPENGADSPRLTDLVPSGAPSTLSMTTGPISTGDNLVLSIQQGLRSAGFDPGPLDGLMGPRTRGAIEAYQAEHGLPVDGRASGDLLQFFQRQAGTGGSLAKPERADTQWQIANFEEVLFGLGAAAASARLSHDEGAYRLDDLRLTLGTKGALWIEAFGGLGTLRPGIPLDGLALTIRFALPSSQMLPAVFPPDMPELKKLHGRIDAQGSLETLSISSARIETVGPNGLTAVANGQIARVSLQPVLEMKGLVFDLEAQSPSTTGVSQLADLDLPELGPVRAQATLRDRGDLFTLSAIDVSAGPAEKPAANVVGQIGNLLAMEQIKLNGDFQIATAKLLQPDVTAEKPALGSFHGQFDLSDADGSIGIETLSIEVKDTELLSLSATGFFDDIPDNDELRFETVLNVPNVSELADEFGFEANRLGGLSFNGQISGSDEHFQGEGKLLVGETDLSGTLAGSLLGVRPALRARLYSPVLHLADIGLLPNSNTSEGPERMGEQKPKPARKWLFSEENITFEALTDFDLDLDVQLDEVEGINFEIDEIEVRLDIVDGLLKVDPLLFSFVGGRVETRLLADARTKVPEVSIDIVADDLDLGDFLAQVEADVPLDGELDMVLHLEANGPSPRALADSLEGDLDLAIAQGHIRTSLLDLTVTNPVRWLFSRSARKGYSDLNCLVVRFDIQEGVAKSVTLLLDTTNVRAQGVGDVDFGDEKMDIDVSPRAKRRRLIAITTPFGFEGSLVSPTVKLDTTGAATRSAGKVLASPINLLGSLLPFVNDRGKDADNPCLHLDSGAG